MVPKDTRQQFPPSLESRPLARASQKPQLPRRCLRAAPCSSRAQTLHPSCRSHPSLLSPKHYLRPISTESYSTSPGCPADTANKTFLEQEHHPSPTPRLPVSPPGTKLPQLPVTSAPTLASIITTSKWQSHPLAPLQPLQWPAAATWALLASPA